MDIRIYGRAVTKEGYKNLRDTSTLYAEQNEEGQLIPAFDATPVLGSIEISQDSIKLLHKLMGGSGAATKICLFKTAEEPVVKDISFRRIQEIKRILGGVITETKFKPGTKIEIVGWV